MRPNRSHVTAAFAFAIAAAVACSGRDRSDGLPGDDFKPPVEGQPCTPGEVRDCGIEVGRTGDAIDCAKGTQTCLDDSSWGACATNGTTFKAEAPPAKSGTPGLGTNAVGGSSTTCVDNPCNPDCKVFKDSPDTGVTSDSTTTVVGSPTVSLENSNVPGGFQNKGTLHSQCSATSGSLAYREACQFDMRCGTRTDGSTGCVAFVPNEKNSCTGVDITAPPVCVPAGATTYRNLTVCNRGSADLTQDIQCMGYPGNSPQFPDDNPGAGQIVLRTGITVDPTTGTTNPITAAKPLKAGECRTYRVPNGNFQSNGTMSIMCNPPATGTTVTTTLLTQPDTAETVDFTNPDNALDNVDSLAAATASFTYAALATAYASGVENNVGFTNPANVTAAANSVGATASLTTTAATVAEAPTLVVNDPSPSGRVWTASAGSTLKDDVATVDTKSARVTLSKSEEAWLKTSGYSFAGASGAITQLDVTLDASYTNAAEIFGRLHIQKGGTVLATRAVTSGTYSIAIPYGSLLASEVGSLSIWVDAVTYNFGGGTHTMTVNRLAVAARYYSPPSASVDATGYAWAAAPAASYTSLEFATRFRSSTTAGGSVYAYAKNSAGTTVASAVFTLPSGYTANTWTTGTQVAAALGLTAADLAAGLKVSLEAFPYPGNTIDIDSVGLRPIYRAGAESRTIRFKGFAFAVPPGATNIRVAALANYKVDPLLTGDQISGTVLSISGSTTTLISTSSATITNNAFNVYQLGYQALTDATSIEDPKLTVDITVKKGAGAPATLGTSTGSLESLTMRLQYDATVGASVGECNPSNNWTVNKANPPTPCSPVTVTTYPPWTVSRVFQASCPAGFRPKWKYAGYTSTTPAGTKIEFRYRAFDPTVTTTGSSVCNALAPVTTSPPVPLATAQLSPNTQVCSLTSGTTTCPVKLGDSLSAVDSIKYCLQMDAYGIPAASPPAAPTLTDWLVTYDCVASE